MALLEARAAGKAIVATDVGGVGHMIKHNVSGLLVRPEDPNALLEAMRLLLGDAPRRRRLGQQARARAKLFGWPAIAAAYERLYALKSSQEDRSTRLARRIAAR